MKNISKVLIVVLSAYSISAAAQHARFTKSGVIEYEKKINMYALIKKNITKENENLWQQPFENYKQNNPQFKVLNSTLTFANSCTLFVPVAPTVAPSGLFKDLPMSGQNNIVFTDLTNNRRVSKKKAYEQTFLVNDSLPKIEWKITDELRTIAGYTCRRANGIVMDSVYVVAFYTPQIPVFGGPESFSGLPGMILGVALPHENVTWFATKVIDTTPAVPVAPKGGKEIKRSDFESQIKSIVGSTSVQSLYLLKDFLL